MSKEHRAIIRVPFDMSCEEGQDCGHLSQALFHALTTESDLPPGVSINVCFSVILLALVKMGPEDYARNLASVMKSFEQAEVIFQSKH